MIDVDKLLHFLVGAVLVLAMGYLATPIYGLLAAVFAGAVKEFYDHYRPMKHTADVMDFYATAAGGCVGSGLVFLIFHWD